MANVKTSSDFLEYATVDTAPSAGGFATNPVDMRLKKIQQMFFSIRGTGVATVTLQFKCYGDSDWTDYYNDGNQFNKGEHVIIDGNAANKLWRAVVKESAYTSGAVTFGFDW